MVIILNLRVCQFTVVYEFLRGASWLVCICITFCFLCFN